MGRKKKERQSVEQLYSTAMGMLVPTSILEDFEM
jgi:hypothetical protein